MQAAQTPPNADSTQTPKAVAADFSNVSVKSAPDGADITIDGKFAGSTPSTLQIKAGEHTISVKKAGYTLWERSITISAGGSISIDAELEKAQ